MYTDWNIIIGLFTSFAWHLADSGRGGDHGEIHHGCKEPGGSGSAIGIPIGNLGVWLAIFVLFERGTYLTNYSHEQDFFEGCWEATESHFLGSHIFLNNGQAELEDVTKRLTEAGIPFKLWVEQPEESPGSTVDVVGFSMVFIHMVYTVHSKVSLEVSFYVCHATEKHESQVWFVGVFVFGHLADVTMPCRTCRYVGLLVRIPFIAAPDLHAIRPSWVPIKSLGIATWPRPRSVWLGRKDEKLRCAGLGCFLYRCDQISHMEIFIFSVCPSMACCWEASEGSQEALTFLGETWEPWKYDTINWSTKKPTNQSVFLVCKQLSWFQVLIGLVISDRRLSASTAEPAEGKELTSQRWSFWCFIVSCKISLQKIVYDFWKLSFCGTVDGKNPASQLIGSLSHYLQGFIHSRWCRISSINSMSMSRKCSILGCWDD